MIKKLNYLEIITCNLKNLRLVFVFLFLLFIGGNKVLCSGAPSDDSKITPVVPKISCLARSLHVTSAIIIYKLLPPPTLTTQYRRAEGCYGFTNGIGLYPGWGRFMNGDLKIGFLFFEHRSWEIIPKLIQLLLCKCKGYEYQYDYYYFVAMFLIFPLSLSILSIKYKFLRMNMFSILEVLAWGVREFGDVEGVKELSLLMSPFLFSSYNKELFGNFFLGLIIFFFPRVSIDMSYFYKNNKNEKLGWED